LHNLADRRLFPPGSAGPRGGRADRRLFALAGFLAGGVPARQARHRLRRHLRLSDVVERVRARLAADALDRLQDAARRSARLHRRIHHRLARHVRACRRHDHPGVGAYLYRAEASGFRADLRFGEGIGHAIVRREELSVARIEKVELRMVDLDPKVKRTDAIQSFVSQETPIVTITDSDGATGTGYSYTIGTGGSSVMRLLADHLVPRLIGRDAALIEEIWPDLAIAHLTLTI